MRNVLYLRFYFSVNVGQKSNNTEKNGLYHKFFLELNLLEPVLLRKLIRQFVHVGVPLGVLSIFICPVVAQLSYHSGGG